MCRIQIFPDDLTIRSRRFASSRLSYGRSKRSAPLTQDLDGVAEVALRRGPVGGHPRTGRGSDSNGAKSHVKGRSWNRLASQDLSPSVSQGAIWRYVAVDRRLGYA